MLVSRKSRKYKGSQFFTCDKLGSDPECPFISWDLPIEGSSCETCGSYMVWKRFRGRSFPRCGNRDCPTNLKKETSGKKEAGEKTADNMEPDTAPSEKAAAGTSKKTASAKKTTAAKKAASTKKTAKKTTTVPKTATTKKTTAAKKSTAAKATKKTADEDKAEQVTGKNAAKLEEES